MILSGKFIANGKKDIYTIILRKAVFSKNLNRWHGKNQSLEEHVPGWESWSLVNTGGVRADAVRINPGVMVLIRVLRLLPGNWKLQPAGRWLCVRVSEPKILPFAMDHTKICEIFVRKR